jgi:Adenylate and Guanylate cyclase catalytic domain
MAQFANACLERFASLIRKLEVKLGPGTADLGMRIGLHSGPITGGILRGERSRFQLFGDTINTAARMESNSMKGRIQLSEQTADLIIAAKLEHWLLKRDDKIEAKGKGVLQTYWLMMTATSKLAPISLSMTEYESNLAASAAATSGNCTGMLSTNHSKLVNYNTECLLGLLKQILARRAISRDFDEFSLEGRLANNKQNVKSVLDELTESIQLPAFHAGIERSKPMDAETVYVDPQVVTQLRGLLQEICQHYNSSNYFHNFEHATHVAMYVSHLPSNHCVD